MNKPICSICGKEIERNDFAGSVMADGSGSRVFHFDCGREAGDIGIIKE